MPELTLRAARPDDAAALLAIYAPYIKETAITFEYTVPTVAQFAARIRQVLEKYPYLVAERDGRIAGYAYAGPFAARAAYGWSAEVSVYVARDLQRAGVGRALYAALEAALAAQNIQNANACIAYPAQEDEYLTQGSLRFHTRMGYRLVGAFDRCGYKFGRWYGMVWMEKHLGSHPADPPAVKPFDEVRGLLAASGILMP